MKRIMVAAAVVVPLLVVGARNVFVEAVNTDSAEVDSLRAAHQRYMQAWTDRDIDTIVEIGTGAVGYGHSTPFPRPVRVRDTFRAAVENFYDMMDVFIIHMQTENYRVVGDTGLAWGHCSYTTKQKDGPQRTVYMRFAHTFAKIDGSWKLVMYHRSLLPTVDVQ
ncbi:MAG: DUF4440 domain-containing protein [Candidatus Latescibacteria bacterium]|nr:DUF4440 domain-containing protein [Candidatus Latescibacterota bacterium]